MERPARSARARNSISKNHPVSPHSARTPLPRAFMSFSPHCVSFAATPTIIFRILLNTRDEKVRNVPRSTILSSIKREPITMSHSLRSRSGRSESTSSGSTERSASRKPKMSASDRRAAAMTAAPFPRMGMDKTRTPSMPFAILAVLSVEALSTTVSTISFPAFRNTRRTACTASAMTRSSL